MDYIFELNHQYRTQFSKILDSYTLDQLNKIPQGFNNNIIWNIGHIIATYDGLCYRLSNFPNQLPDEYVNKYKKGTKPETPCTQEEVDYIKKMLFEQLKQSEKDYSDNRFGTRIPYTTSFGNELKSIEDTFKFNLVHEGLHYGIILSLKKFI